MRSARWAGARVLSGPARRPARVEEPVQQPLGLRLGGGFQSVEQRRAAGGSRCARGPRSARPTRSRSVSQPCCKPRSSSVRAAARGSIRSRSSNGSDPARHRKAIARSSTAQAGNGTRCSTTVGCSSRKRRSATRYVADRRSRSSAAANAERRSGGSGPRRTTTRRPLALEQRLRNRPRRIDTRQQLASAPVAGPIRPPSLRSTPPARNCLRPITPACATSHDPANPSRHRRRHRRPDGVSPSTGSAIVQGLAA